jgi:Ca2+-binding RTX toxin-like protein
LYRKNRFHKFHIPTTKGLIMFKFGSNRRRVQSCSQRSCRLDFEPLEDRRVLAAVFWDGGAGTFNWNDATNWSGDSLPGEADDVTIDVAGTDVAVSLSGHHTSIKSLDNRETLIVNLTSALVVSGIGVNSGVVEVQSGSLRLVGGGTHTGDFSGVSGGAIEFGGNHTLAVGADIMGDMDVRFSAGVSTYEGSLTTTGVVTFDRFIIGGSKAAATVTNIAGSITAGAVLASNASAVVQGPIVADVMELMGGGLTGPSEWTVNDRLFLFAGSVGGAGQLTVAVGATMSIEFGAALHRDLVNNGSGSWTAGHIVGMKDATFTNNGSFTVSGSGDLMAEGGNNLFLNNGSFTKLGSGNVGFSNVPFHNSGALEVISGTLTFGNSYVQTNGTTLLNGGQITTSTALDIQGGQLSGAGSVLGSISNGGTTTPGFGTASPDLITLNGNYTQTSSGALSVEIGGPSNGFISGNPREYDQLGVNGLVNLDGALQINLFNNFTPQLNDQFLLVNNDGADAVIGQFDNNVVAIGPIEFSVLYNGGDGNDVVLKVTRVAINEKPVANSQTVSVTEDGSIGVTLSGSDAETAEVNLTLEVISLPAKGTLSYQGHALRQDASGAIYIDDGAASPARFVGPPQLNYEPNIGCGCTADDSFSFVVTDRGDPENDPNGDAPLTSDPGVVSFQIVAAVAEGQVTVDAAGIVRIGGSSGDDDIRVAPQPDGQFLEVRINGAVVRDDILISTVNEIRAWGREGHDRIELAGLAIKSLLDGGLGDDEVIGAAGRDLIFGGMGNDVLTGAAGDDFLIGGGGADRIVGSAGHDILVAGDIACHFTDDDLRLISLDWAANRAVDDGFADDVLDELSDGFDMLTGSSGADWFIISNGDKVTDFKYHNTDGDIVTLV